MINPHPLLQITHMMTDGDIDMTHMVSSMIAWNCLMTYHFLDATWSVLGHLVWIHDEFINEFIFVTYSVSKGIQLWKNSLRNVKLTKEVKSILHYPFKVIQWNLLFICKIKILDFNSFLCIIIYKELKFKLSSTFKRFLNMRYYFFSRISSSKTHLSHQDDKTTSF